MIHPSADVQTKKISPSTDVWQYSIILANAEVGSDCNINCHCFIENDVVIGDRVTIKAGVQIWDGISIADDVFIGPNVTFANDKHPRSKHYPEQFEKTDIHQGASLGANATILPGLSIGAYSMIGAGSVLTKSTPNNSLWFGNPAKLHGYICQQGHRLNQQNYCDICDFQLTITPEKS